jgi:cytochrome c oxidase subunit 2
MEFSTAQSALHPAENSAAALLGELGNVLYIGAAAIFLFVMTLAVYALFAKTTEANARRWIVGGGLIFPIVTLTALLVYSLAVGNAISAIGSTNALQLFLDCFGGGRTNAPQSSDRLLRMHVIGKQWWWEVRYEQPGRTTQIVAANELRIPVDRPVELVLSTSDVIHSFWVPSLAGKVDMIPGRTTRLRLQTSEVGRFRGQCAEYCGGQHALMSLFVITQPVAAFDEWLLRESQAASVPTDPLLKRGYDAFFTGKCQECHAIRGTPAAGTRGPDLTHIGGRTSLAAGVLNNHIGTMAGWIAGAQDVKPGNLMPSMPIYSGEDLRALSAWLGSLE